MAARPPSIGKNTGDDFRERKLTLPVIKAVAQADAEERAFWVRVIEKGDQRDGDLAQAHGDHGAARRDGGRAGRGAGLGRRARGRPWRRCPTHPLRDMLDDLADYVVARIS